MTTRARPFIVFLPTLLASAALLSGCTTSLSAALDTGTGAPPPGIPYRLPTKAIVVDATWLPHSCDIIVDAQGDFQLVSVFTTTATLSEQLGEGERLVMDYTKMATTFKTGQIDVSYWKLGEGKEARPTALLKSFNAEIKGEEAAALAAGIKAAGSIASLAMGLPVPVTTGAAETKDAPPPSIPVLKCNPALFETAPAKSAETKTDKPQPETGHIVRLRETPARLKAIAQAIAEKTLELSAIKTRTLGTLSERDQQRFDTLNADAEKLAKEREALKQDAALITTAFGLKDSVTQQLNSGAINGSWPIALNTLQPDTAKLRALALRMVVCNPEAKLSESQCKGYQSNLARNYGRTEQTRADELALTLFMHRPVAQHAAGTDNDQAALIKAASKGIAYREPAGFRFTLELPALADPDPNKPARRAAETLVDTTIMVPQLGRISSLPLKSDFGEKAGLAAEFEQDGMPIRITYKKLESGGAALAKSLQLGADQVNGLISASKAKADAAKAAADAKAKEAAGSELAGTNAQIELLTAQIKRDALVREGTPDQAAADRAAELEILRFEKEKAELRQAIAKAKAQ